MSIVTVCRTSPTDSIGVAAGIAKRDQLLFLPSMYKRKILLATESLTMRKSAGSQTGPSVKPKTDATADSLASRSKSVQKSSRSACGWNSRLGFCGLADKVARGRKPAGPPRICSSAPKSPAWISILRHPLHDCSACFAHSLTVMCRANSSPGH